MIPESKYGKQVLLVSAALVGFATPALAPQDWVLGIFLGAIVLSAILAIAMAIDAKETKPEEALLGIVALLVVGTSRRRPNIAAGPLSNYFFAAFIFLGCFTTSLVVLSQA